MEMHARRKRSRRENKGEALVVVSILFVSSRRELSQASKSLDLTSR